MIDQAQRVPEHAIAMPIEEDPERPFVTGQGGGPQRGLVIHHRQHTLSCPHRRECDGLGANPQDCAMSSSTCVVERGALPDDWFANRPVPP
ncbi:hypothetical protein GCM10009869_31830 [Amnibacterium kyonggiense]